MDDEIIDGVRWHDGLPTRSHDQSCALCGVHPPRWIHPLDPNQVQYRLDGSGYTLPTFWCLCNGCENSYHQGLDADLIEIMLTGQWSWATDPAGAAHARHALATFRRADLGGKPLPA